MNFELNKVAGAVLGTLLFAMGSGFLAELIYEPKPAGKAGYPLPEPQPKSAAGDKAEAPKAEPIAARLASADAAKGEAGTKACKGCHSVDKAGTNGVGPGLWEVVERPKGGHAGFNYSAALKEKGGTWSYEDLDHFIEKPKGFIKDTKMVFPGIASPQERANVIAYLRNLSESPKPLPVAKNEDAAKPAEGAKPVDSGKPADAGTPEEAKPAEAKAKPEGGSGPEAGKPEAATPEEGTNPAESNPAEPNPADAPPAEPAPAPEKPAQQ